MTDPVTSYLELGLRLGRHIDGFVDAYYGPPDLERRVDEEAPLAPHTLVADSRRLLGALSSGEGDVDAGRRRWLHAQIVGLETTARRLEGEPLSYTEEVERCYGVRPSRIPEDELRAAHRRLDEALAGSGALRDRLIGWRESQTVKPERLEAAVASLHEDFRERTRSMFGLPDGEGVEFELVTDRPWSGFNWYLGELRSRVAINTDLPVLSPSLGHLVAHEAYPGHHTEHATKEVALVQGRAQLEETIFLVGTPQCLVAEGLAELAIEVLLGPHPQSVIADHLRPLGIPYDAEVTAAISDAGETVGRARVNVAWLLHHDGGDPSDAVAYAERWLLLPHDRAVKVVEFLTDPLWRAYTSCYDEGLPLCRAFVAGEPARFERLLSEQLAPDDLHSALR